jgi:hypothetical protein
VIRWFSVRSLALALLLAIPGCDSPLWPGGGAVRIRIANLSSYPFERVDVVFPENEVSYGAVPSHGLSDYRDVSTAYRYAYIEVQIAGEELVIQPIDYVGENKLGAGKYTYALNVSVEGHLTLQFQED